MSDEVSEVDESEPEWPADVPIFTPECPECPAEVDVVHAVNCPIALCLECGGSRVNCAEEGEHDCGDDAWTGFMFSELDCIRFGLYAYFGPPWTPCGPDHPGATPDFDALPLVADWNREQRRWIRRPVDTDEIPPHVCKPPAFRPLNF